MNILTLIELIRDNQGMFGDTDKGIFGDIHNLKIYCHDSIISYETKVTHIKMDYVENHLTVYIDKDYLTTFNLNYEKIEEIKEGELFTYQYIIDKLNDLNIISNTSTIWLNGYDADDIIRINRRKVIGWFYSFTDNILNLTIKANGSVSNED